MKRLMALGLAFATTLFWAGAARADNGECSAGVKIADKCNGLDYFGCCKNNIVVWCETDGTAVCAIDCNQADDGTKCGWKSSETFEGYDCGTDGSADPSKKHPIDCTMWTCTPNCGAKKCGDDGCLGSCGTCPAETPECTEAGECVKCAPKCKDKNCGDDGCGGVCGTCGEGELCLPSQKCCKPSCEGKECGDDGCGTSCGKTCPAGKGCDTNGKCVDVPTPCTTNHGSGCPGCACEKCVCDMDDYCCNTDWDELCVQLCEEDCGGDKCPQDLCFPDCEGKICGDDGCGGECGKCAEGSFCGHDGKKCWTCTCDGKTCGDDGCGNSCGTCKAGETCEKGTCVPAGCGATPDVKGCNGCACEKCVCDADKFCCETEWDSMCAEQCIEDCKMECPCVKDCEQKECGDDGCGGQCGTCAGGAVCDDGMCCTPKCENKECGDNGCGGDCGTCAAGMKCEAGKCVVCQPKCDGKQCGDDGCGGQCGQCKEGQECVANKCMDKGCGNVTFEGCCDGTTLYYCEADELQIMPCGDNNPPDNTCGWSAEQGYYDCGQTGADPSGKHPIECSATCTKDCTNKECGDDGCGGLCGTCQSGFSCQNFKCVEDVVEPSPDVIETDVSVSTDTVQPPEDIPSGNDTVQPPEDIPSGNDTVQPPADIPVTPDPGSKTDVPVAKPDTSTTPETTTGTDTTVGADTGTTTKGGGGGGGCTAGAGPTALPFALLLTSMGLAILRRRDRD